MAQKSKLAEKQVQAMERMLTDYVKYLTGQKTERLNRAQFSDLGDFGSKSLDQPFQDYIHEQGTGAMGTIANDIIQRVDYNTVQKEVCDPISELRYADNPSYAFFKVCQKDQELALPLL